MEKKKETRSKETNGEKGRKDDIIIWKYLCQRKKVCESSDISSYLIPPCYTLTPVHSYCKLIVLCRDTRGVPTANNVS